MEKQTVSNLKIKIPLFLQKQIYFTLHKGTSKFRLDINFNSKLSHFIENYIYNICDYKNSQLFVNI